MKFLCVIFRDESLKIEYGLMTGAMSYALMNSSGFP